MNYHGIEIFFQNLGNADSIFVRHWHNGVPTNILIDGGWRRSADQVEEFLSDRAAETNVNTIHHLICTHSDDDHASGLVELVERESFPIGKAWVHDASATSTLLSESWVRTMQRIGAARTLRRIEESEKTRQALVEALWDRDIEPKSPFAGTAIGPMVVLGPTQEFYTTQMERLLDESVLRRLEARFRSREVNKLMEVVESKEQTRVRLQKEDNEKKLGGAPTSPVNEVSTVLALPWCDFKGTHIHLFTGDVGREGLDDVLVRCEDILHNIRWLDVPHHGSRRSMTPEMIEFLAPKTSFISGDGDGKHPSRKLVNALKKHGEVYSTHYSVGSRSWLRQHYGDVPALSGVPAIALYDKA
jgi:beta-lactamase superfamily II metal-dependent hydrolase